jgi:thiol-disulfide isomerase/thioredoxin
LIRAWSASFVLASLSTGCLPRLYSEVDPDTGTTSITSSTVTWVGPTNSWEVTGPPAGTVGEGYEVGQTVPDVRLIDQHGDEVSLWQFYGDVMLLDISTIWCGPCQDLGAHTEAVWQDYGPELGDGFIYLTALQEDLEGGLVDPEDVQLWVDTFAISAPVLADSGKEVAAVSNGQYPAVILIGRDLKVIQRVQGTADSEIRAAIEGAL